MDATAPPPPAPAPPAPVPAGTDRTRLWSAGCALLFAPAALVTWILTLLSERAARCLTYGEGCEPGLPDSAFDGSLGLGVVACAVALAAPAVRVRRVALAVQLLAECMALVVILSRA
ncbi:hypothetical protein ACIQNG_22245 [Streptomyces sp. NPDC091377]|uniref:hypothetical protein n=1 Tax=Streptomyces sp. NPDC091377 TaxID=3365995 RepID=UPI00380E76F9